MADTDNLGIAGDIEAAVRRAGEQGVVVYRERARASAPPFTG